MGKRPPKSKQPGKNVMKKGVLVIDDDLNTCRELKTTLENEEIEVYCTLSVSEALRVFMKWDFCLAIIDIRLPENNGCEVLKIMWQTRAIPTLVLSAKTSASERTAILEAGANVYLEKLYDVDEVLAQARSLIDLCTASKTLENHHCTLAFGTELIIDPTY